MPLIQLTVDVSEEVLAVLRHCASGQPVRIKDIRQWGDAFLTAIRLGLVVREHGPLREFVYPASDIGRLVLAAHDRPGTADARDKVVEAARDLLRQARGFLQVCDRPGEAREAYRGFTLAACNHLRDALADLSVDAAKQGKGEGL